MRLNLSKKIIITIEACVLLSIILLGVITYIFLGDTLKSETNSRLSSISYLKGNYIKQYLDFRTSEIEAVAKSKYTNASIVNLLLGKKNNLSLTLLTDGIINTKSLLELSVVDKNGKVISSTNDQEIGKIKENEIYFIEAKNKTTVQMFNYDISDKKIVTIISTPVVDKKGNFIGILSEKIDNTEINQLMYDRNGLGVTGETYLVNSSNFVTTDLLKEPGSILKKTIFLPQVNQCLDKNSNFYYLKDYHGDLVYGYARWFPEIDSCLITKIDQKEVAAPISGIIAQIIALVVIVGTTSLIFGYFISSSIVRPLRVLRGQVLKITDGDLNVQIQSNSNDEIGDMANSFKEMLSKLKELYLRLEEKVKERTLELEKSEKKLEEALSVSEKNNKMMIGRELEMIKLKQEISNLKESKKL